MIQKTQSHIYIYIYWLFININNRNFPLSVACGRKVFHAKFVYAGIPLGKGEKGSNERKYLPFRRCDPRLFEGSSMIDRVFIATVGLGVKRGGATEVTILGGGENTSVPCWAQTAIVTRQGTKGTRTSDMIPSRTRGGFRRSSRVVLDADAYRGFGNQDCGAPRASALDSKRVISRRVLMTNRKSCHMIICRLRICFSSVDYVFTVSRAWSFPIVSILSFSDPYEVPLS